MRLALLLALAACNGGDDDDTDAIDDTDVGDTDPADTDVEDTDTDEPDPDRITVEVRADGGQAGFKVAAVLARTEGDGVTEVREYATVDAASFPVAVTLDPPGGDDLSALNGTTTGALLFWIVYDDADGSGDRGVDEPILATSNEVLAWIEDGDQFDRIWVGLSLDLLGDGSPGIFDAFDGYDLRLFGERPAATVGGTGTTVTPDRLATLSVAEIDQETALPSRPYDAAWAGDPWSVTVDQPLADERLYESGLGRIGVEAIVASTDVNGDGDYDPGETVLANACHETLPVGLLYVPQPFELTDALVLYATGFDVGWNPVALLGDNEIPEALTDSEAMALVLGDCAL